MAERRYFGDELAERVERADQLKERDIVFTRCDECGGRFHRGWLTEHMTATRLDNGMIYGAWLMEPKPLVHHGGRGRYLIGDETVPQGYVWRVVDELRDDDTVADEVRADERQAAILAERKRRPVPVEERN